MPLLPVLILIFIFIPLIEIYLIIEIGSVIGAFATVLAIAFTAILGISLIRIQGFSTMKKAQQAMDKGVLPATEMIEGVMLLIAALMLLIPGFFTDTLGFLLLIPPIRHILASRIASTSQLNARFNKRSPADGSYIDGEYEDMTSEQQKITRQYDIEESNRNNK